MWLLDFYTAIIGGVGLSTLPLFFYLCTTQDMIFEGYYRILLAKLYYQIKPSVKYKGGFVYFNRRRGNHLKRVAFKLLGGCVFCYGFWLVFITSLFLMLPQLAVVSGMAAVCFMYYFVFKLK